MESRIIRHRVRICWPLGAELVRNAPYCRADRLQMAVIFGHLPKNVEPKQRPLAHRRDSPAAVFEERHGVMTVDDAGCGGFDHRPIKSLIIHYLWRSGAAFDQLRSVSVLHLRWDMLGQPVDTPAC